MTNKYRTLCTILKRLQLGYFVSRLFTPPPLSLYLSLSLSLSLSLTMYNHLFHMVLVKRIYVPLHRVCSSLNKNTNKWILNEIIQWSRCHVGFSDEVWKYGWNLLSNFLLKLCAVNAVFISWLRNASSWL